MSLKPAYPKWIHRKDCTEEDPVNLVFKSILSRVVSCFDRHGWHRPMTAHDRYLRFKDGCVRRQDAQRVYGNPLWLGARYHVRLWSMNDVIIGSVHFETLSLVKGHVTHTYEGAEKRVTIEFYKCGWKVYDDSIPMGNYVGYPYNNGFATEVKPP